MGNNPENIERFIRNQMPPEERAAFEKEMARNGTLAEAVKAEKELHIYLQFIAERRRVKEYREMIREGNVQQNSVADEIPQVKPPRALLRYFLLAASVALLLVAGTWFWKQQSVASLNDLVESYYEPYEIGSRKGSDSQEKNLEQQANEFYQQKEYAKAIPFLEQLYETSPEYHLMAGIAYFETQDFENALKQFELLINNKAVDPNLLYTDRAKWYAALTHLQVGHKSTCISFLKGLLGETAYTKQAKELLGKIE